METWLMGLLITFYDFLLTHVETPVAWGPHIIDTTDIAVATSLTKKQRTSLKGLGSNPGEDMDVCKCTVPSRHGGTLNSRRAANLLVRLVEGEERWEASDHPPECSPSNFMWNRVKSYCHLHGAQSYG
ncbi:uncharacterized protein TNCV_3797631 [Trichonephila clavipes]|nr:uncharacterized protein TNCV_3797631 [Trichonephila clavipes]